MTSAGRRASLVQNLERESGGGMTLHMAKRQRDGVDGRRIDCTITGYCQTRIFDFPGVMLTEDSEVGPHVISEENGFRATIASDLECYFESVSTSRHHSIDRSLRIGVENLARTRRERRPSGELALNAHRYRFRHREFHFALNWLRNYRFGGSQFSGMILSADFGGRTPVLSCSLWLEGTRSGSPGCAGPVPHP